jgi:hypothetical protein
MLLALALFAAAPGAHPPLFPVRAGQCQWVRGGFSVANGSSVNRLFVSGTHHLLALYDDDARVPPAIAAFWKQEPMEHRLWGDFFVCARERYVAGHMQHVRIVRTRRTSVRPL